MRWAPAALARSFCTSCANVIVADAVEKQNQSGIYYGESLYDGFKMAQENGGPEMAEDIQIKREIVLEADAETLERMRKEGHARGFTVYCDEAERTGGDNSAPPPLAYFGLALAF